MEIFQKFVKGMDDKVKHLIGVFHDNRKRHTGREYHVTKVNNFEYKQYVWSYCTEQTFICEQLLSFSLKTEENKGKENQFIFTVLIQ